MKIAVVGGGISGIISSIGLVERGHDVHLFEKTECLGGRIKSKHKEGITFDIGFHVLHTGYSTVAKWIDVDTISHYKMHPSSSLISPSSGKKKIIGDVFSAPSTLLGSATSMSPFNALRLLKWRMSNTKSQDVKNLDSRKKIDYGFSEKGFSANFQKQFLEPLFAGITLSEERLEAIEFADFIWGVMSKAPIILPKEGMRSIIDQLQKKMGNVNIHLNSTIENLSKNSVTLNGKVEEFDRVILATSQNITYKFLNLDLEGEKRQTRTYVYKTKSNPIRKLQIMLNSEYDRTTSPILHVHSPTAVNQTKDHLVIATMIGHACQNENWELTDTEMKKWFPNDFASFERFDSTYIEHALPNSVLEGNARIPHEVDGILIAGDHTRHPSLHGAILSAEKVIQSVGVV